MLPGCRQAKIQHERTIPARCRLQGLLQRSGHGRIASEGFRPRRLYPGSRFFHSGTLLRKLSNRSYSQKVPALWPEPFLHPSPHFLTPSQTKRRFLRIAFLVTQLKTHFVVSFDGTSPYSPFSDSNSHQRRKRVQPASLPTANQSSGIAAASQATFRSRTPPATACPA